MGTLKENGDLLGTQKLKKVPMGTRVPKWGPTWEQCFIPQLSVKDQTAHLLLTAAEPFNSVLLQQL